MDDFKNILKELVISHPETVDFIQSTAVDGMWIWDVKDVNKSWISDSFWITLGIEPAKAIKDNLKLQDFVYPEDSENASIAAKQHYANHQTPFRITIRYKKFNGDTAHLDTRGKAIIGDDGEPQYMIGIAHDITEQIESHQKLTVERDQFRAIIDGSDLGTWEWNVQTGETRFNEKWAEIIGYKLSELEPVSIDTWVKFAKAEDLEKSNASLEKHFKGESEFYYSEARMQHKNGSWIWVQDKGKVISWTDDGKPEWMVGSHQDITKKRIMERSLAKAYRENKTLIEQSPVSIAMFDKEMNYLAASPLWREENGLSKIQFIGRNHYEIVPIVKEEWKLVHKRALNGETVTCDEEFFTDIDVNEKWMKWDVRPWKLGREIGGIIIHTQDITKTKLHEIELRKTKELLEKTNEIADIGSWKVNLEEMSTTWSQATKRIHEIDDPNYQSDVESGILFYKEGWSRERITTVFSSSVESGIPFDEELIIVTAKGNEKWVRAIGIPEMKNGKCIYMHGLFVDIDRIKKQQINIQEISENYRSVLMSMPSKIYKLDKSGIVLAKYGNGEFIDVQKDNLPAEESVKPEIEPLALKELIDTKGLDFLVNNDSIEIQDKNTSIWYIARAIKDGVDDILLQVSILDNKK